MVLMERDDLPAEILLVEGHAPLADLAVQTLGASGITAPIHVVRDGMEALEYVFRTGRYTDRTPTRIGLILIDLQHAGPGAIDVRGRVEGAESTRGIPVVMFSATGTTDTDEAAGEWLAATGLIGEILRGTGMIDIAQTASMRFPTTIEPGFGASS